MGEQPFQWESGDPVRVRMLQELAASQAAGRVKRLKKLAARVDAASGGHVHGTARDKEQLAQQQNDDYRASAERQQHLDSLRVERLSTLSTGLQSLSVSEQQPLPLPCVHDGETTTPGLVHRRGWSDRVGPTMDLGPDDGPGPSSDGLTEAAASVSGTTLARLEKAAWACVGRLNPRDGDNRRLVLARLQEIGLWAVPGSSMLLFGSTACDLHADGADLDLTLIPQPHAQHPPSYVEQQALVRHLAVAFQPGQASGEFTQVTRGSGPRTWFGWFGWLANPNPNPNPSPNPNAA